MLGSRVAIGEKAIGQFETFAASSVVASTGSYAYTGNATGLTYGHKLTAATGSYTYTGVAAAFARTNRLLATPGSYAITGQTTVLRGAFRLVASKNTREAATVYKYVLFASLGEVSLGGSATASVTEPANTYAYTGYDVNLRRGISMAAAAGAYTWTGVSASYVRTWAIIASPGAYTITGGTAHLNVSMTAAAGSYVVTGKAVQFNRVRKRVRAFTRVGSSITARAA